MAIIHYAKNGIRPIVLNVWVMQRLILATGIRFTMTDTLPPSKGDVIIRIATYDDAEAIFALRLEALKAHPEAFAADVEITKTRGVTAWVDLINQDTSEQSGVIVIASAGEALVGMAGVGRGHWPKTRHSGFVWGVYVTPAWRRRNIANAMLDECVKWASEHTVVVLKLGVVTTNEPAIRCYQRCGFTIYGTEPKSNYVDGIYYDEYLMSRLT
jgi:RimJ/RimL family protein N-acetyltransferase